MDLDDERGEAGQRGGRSLPFVKVAIRAARTTAGLMVPTGAKRARVPEARGTAVAVYGAGFSTRCRYAHPCVPPPVHPRGRYGGAHIHPEKVQPPRTIRDDVGHERRAAAEREQEQEQLQVAVREVLPGVEVVGH